MTESCEIIQERLYDYLHRRLSWEESSEIVRHLAVCPVCRREAAALCRLAQAAQALTPPVPPDLRREAFRQIRLKKGEAVRLEEILAPLWESLELARKTVRFALLSG